MTHSRTLHILVLVAMLLLPAVAGAQCTPFGLGIYYADLKIPFEANVAHFPGHTGSVVKAAPQPKSRTPSGSASTESSWGRATGPAAASAGC